MSLFPLMTKSTSLFNHPKLQYSPEVLKALSENRPVCSLESTIISHGMPYPENFETAKELEEIVRREGATPATIGIIGGVIKIGLTQDELHFLSQDNDIMKISTRNIPIALALNKNGATTVAGTIHLANLVGIHVMATGGIGGVHRNGESTLDISADLTELSNSRVAVVCAGAKSILDIGKTLEVLETLNVPVLGYQTDSFPAFYLPKSEFKLDDRFDDAKEIAAFLNFKWQLHQKGGAIIANPVPKESAMDEKVINEAIHLALKNCEEKGIHGKEVTPYLLKIIKETTKGDSLTTNIALVKNNAKLGGQLAKLFTDHK